MPRDPHKEQPESNPDERRQDRPWHVVDAIEPDDDVLSRLAAEDDAGRAVARARRGAVLASAEPDQPHESVLPPARPPRRWLRLVLVSAMLVGVVALIAWPMAGGRWLPSLLTPPANGTLVIESRPAGVPVTIDGVAQGHTPVSVLLEPGRHTVVLAGAVPRELTVSIDPGARVSQYIEMPEVPAAGILHVETTVPGAEVSVDGTPHGVTPLDIAGLEPGIHVVSLRHGSTSMTQQVTVRAGDTLSLVVPLAQFDAASPGWVVIASPIELHLYEGGRLINTSRADRVLMLAGRHDLRLVNLPLGFETARVVQVTPGKVTTLAVEPPNGVLHVTAVPWAEVFMDGTRIGDTPIANYPASLGSHEIVLRNPQFAERRVIVTVTLTTPARVGVDLQR